MVNVKSVDVRMDVSGYDKVKAEIDDIAARAEELKLEHPEISPQIDSTKALLQAGLLREELKRELSGESIGGGGGGGLVGDLLYGAGAAGGDAGSGSGGAGDTAATALGQPLLVAAIGAAVLALSAEITGLVNGMLAATAGVGALALVAIPTFERVKTALADTPAELKKQPPLIQEIVGKVDQLKTSFDKIGQSMMPQLLGIFNQGLGVAAGLMPVLAQFAQVAAPAVHEIMTDLGKAVNSQGFKDFVDQFSKISGPAIEAIGGGVGHVADKVGKLATVMSAHDVVHAINIFFDAIADGVQLASGFIARLMSNWDEMSNAAKIAAAVVTSSWTASKTMIESVAGTVNNTVNNINDAVRRVFVSDIPAWLEDAVGAFRRLPGDINSAMASLGDMMFRAGENAIDAIGRGIEAAVGSVLGDAEAAGHAIASAIVNPFGIHLSEPSEATVMIAAGLRIPEGLSTGISQGAPGLAAQLAGIGVGVGGGSLTVAGAAGGGVVQNFTLNFGIVGNPVEAGRQIVTAIRSFEQKSGRGWRTH